MLPFLVSREDTFSLILLKNTSYEASPGLNEVRGNEIERESERARRRERERERRNIVLPDRKKGGWRLKKRAGRQKESQGYPLN